MKNIINNQCYILYHFKLISFTFFLSLKQLSYLKQWGRNEILLLENLENWKICCHFRILDPNTV